MLSLREQAAAVATGSISPREVVEEALAAISRVQPTLNAFTHVFADDALTRAKELESIAPSGPLHGVPVAVKELYDVAGAPTTGCCAAYHDRIAQTDSIVVERLRAAGAIIVAKTNQHELAMGGTTQNSSFGPAWNPRDPTRMTGGSSGGSAAAVAAGVVAMAMGSDSLGSIRIPSSWCGTTGLKNTHGLIPMDGAMPFLPSFDSAGPIAADAEGCGIVFRVLAGSSPVVLRSRPRIALMRGWLSLCTTEVRVAVEQTAATFTSLGCSVTEIEGPDPDVWSWMLPCWREFADAYRDLWDGGASEEAAFLLGVGQRYSDAEVAVMQARREAYHREWRAALDGFDAALAPATPFPAPLGSQEMVEVEGGELDVRSGCARFTTPVNAVGVPSLSFPVGLSSEGLPLGAQLIGAADAEETLVALGVRFQDATGA